MSTMTQAQVNAHEARLLADKLRRNPGVCYDSSQAEPLEATLHEKIGVECKRRGWIALHGRMDMETGRTIGEPDFVILADAGRVFLIECKSKTGKVSPAQAALHAWASKLGHSVYTIRSLQQFLELVKL